MCVCKLKLQNWAWAELSIASDKCCHKASFGRKWVTCPFLEASLRNVTINFQGGLYPTHRYTRHPCSFWWQTKTRATRCSRSSDNNWLRGHGRNPQCRISGGCHRAAAALLCALYCGPDPLSSSESPKLSIHSQKNANFAAPNEEFRLLNEQSLHQSNGRWAWRKDFFVDAIASQ